MLGGINKLSEIYYPALRKVCCAVVLICLLNPISFQQSILQYSLMYLTVEMVLHKEII